MMRDELDS